MITPTTQIRITPPYTNKYSKQTIKHRFISPVHDYAGRRTRENARRRHSAARPEEGGKNKAKCSNEKRQLRFRNCLIFLVPGARLELARA